ncbi:MAG: hypothetical protein VB025_04825 [Sphaerochaeta sp.]|jgi:hypothetical protein|nr:hypothetical protein [Sphaerochaeta sp.]PKL25311.1 MAG: hypothetical protein CVV46_16330 [Spirochaetae bacterium HGW-Spirochaetae-2]
MDTYEEYNRIRGILITLEVGKLADALMTLALESHSAQRLVRTLASTTEENIELFKETIHDITHQTRRRSFSGEMILEMLTRSLEMLDPSIVEPKLGLELMASFYETDSVAINSSTELDYEFEMVYSSNGFEKFAEFARKCPDSDFVVQVVKRLVADDDYSMRTKLLDEASSFLSEAALAKLGAGRTANVGG